MRWARDFELHYSAASRATAGFLADLARAPWRDRVLLHLKDEGGRADLAALVPRLRAGLQLYTCGSPRYMDAVFAAAARAAAGPRRRCTASTSACPRRRSCVNHPFAAAAGAQRPRAAGAGRRAAPPRCWPQAGIAVAHQVQRRPVRRLRDGLRRRGQRRGRAPRRGAQRGRAGAASDPVLLARQGAGRPDRRRSVMSPTLPGRNAPSAGFEAPLEMLGTCHGRIEHQCKTLRRLLRTCLCTVPTRRRATPQAR